MKQSDTMETEIDYDNQSTVPLQPQPDEMVRQSGGSARSNGGNPYLKILAGTIIGAIIVAGPLYLLGKMLPAPDGGKAPRVASGDLQPSALADFEAAAAPLSPQALSSPNGAPALPVSTDSTAHSEAGNGVTDASYLPPRNRFREAVEARRENQYPIGNRPVELIARDLGVTPEKFRAAFAKVTPAPRGTRPTHAQKEYNRNVLLRELGVTQEKLNEVMDKYRPEGPAH